MAVYDSSLLGHESPSEQEEGFKDILDVTVDPALEMCRRMTELDVKKDVTGWDRSIFLINCIVYLQVSNYLSSPLLPYLTYLGFGLG
jgi:conserved oligomeric Golgi complex subunit 6